MHIKTYDLTERGKTRVKNGWGGLEKPLNCQDFLSVDIYKEYDLELKAHKILGEFLDTSLSQDLAEYCHNGIVNWEGHDFNDLEIEVYYKMAMQIALLKEGLEKANDTAEEALEELNRYISRN